jgi:malate synthase
MAPGSPTRWPAAREVFDTYMPFNQTDKKPATKQRHRPADLLAVPTEPSIVRPEPQHRRGPSIPRHLLCGNGCVPIYNLMEDAATAGSRAQVQARIKYISDGQRVTADMVRQFVKHYGERLAAQFPPRELSLACRLYEEGMTNEEFPEFLTLSAYEMLE